MQNTDDTKSSKFSIDRKSKKCHTPRRNPQVEDALSFLGAFYFWGTFLLSCPFSVLFIFIYFSAAKVSGYFQSEVFPQQLNHGLDLSSLTGGAIFVPVLPLFEDSSSSSSSSSSAITSTVSHDHSTKIPPVFMNSFLAEQARSLEEKRKDIAKTFTQNEKLITILEANFIVLLSHLKQVCEHYAEGVDFIEDMLYKQLVAAIGKVVTPGDFSNYLTFHNRKIFTEQYRPQAFRFAIRRPDHYPEVF